MSGSTFSIENGSGAGPASSTSTNATLWLIIWMVNNIGITLLNKAAFATVDFHYPYFLSAIHMACNGLGAHWLFYLQRRRNASAGGKAAHEDDDEPSKNDTDGTVSTTPLLSSTATTTAGSNGSTTMIQTQPEFWLTTLLGKMQRQKLDRRTNRLMLAFSVIFSMNIAIGNVSLRHVSVNFNQVMRSLVPAITIAMGYCLGKRTSTRRIIAVTPVVVGVAMACFGDMSYSTLGFVYTVLCIVLAALKVVASGEMLTGSQLHPVDLLGHMAPLALLQCLVISLCVGEVASIADRWENELSPFTASPMPMIVVGLSGIFSFSLNICSLQANKLTSPLTLCIAANVKQVLMIALSTMLFGTEISPLNGAGIFVVLAGSARYSFVSLQEKGGGGGGGNAKSTGGIGGGIASTSISNRSNSISISGIGATNSTHMRGKDDAELGQDSIDDDRDVDETDDATSEMVPFASPPGRTTSSRRS